MDWIGILVIILSGAVAALIAQLVVGFKKGRSGVAAAVSAVLFLCIPPADASTVLRSLFS